MRKHTVRHYIRRTRKGRVPVKQHYRKNRGMGVYIYRKSLGGKHTGDITNPEIAEAYGTKPYPMKDVDTEAKQIKLAVDLIKEDLQSGKNDINEVRVTDKNDFMLMHYDAKSGRTGVSGDVADAFKDAIKSKKNRGSWDGIIQAKDRRLKKKISIEDAWKDIEEKAKKETERIFKPKKNRGALPNQVGDYKIRYVGDRILKDYAGMNHFAGKAMGFQPLPERDTILIDKDMKRKVQLETIKHEVAEVDKMKQGHNYWEAHKHALKVEKQ